MMTATVWVRPWSCSTLTIETPPILLARADDRVKRCDSIVGLGGAAVWQLVARARQPRRMRRIGVLDNRVADDPELQAELGAFLQGSAFSRQS